MYITTPKRKNGSTVVRLVVSFWKDGKVKNRIVKTIGQSKDPKIIEQYKTTAKKILEQHKKGLISFSELSEKIPIDLCRFLGKERYNNGFEDIFGTSYQKLGFQNLIKSGKNNKSLNKVLKDFVLMRLFSPSSKLRSCYLLEEYFNKRVSHKQALVMMDHLSKKEDEIRGKIFQSVLKSKDQLEVLLFDVTTLWFESVNADDLRDFGYSKDGKFNEVQVVLGVLANEEGMPLAYEVFPGCTGEARTFQSVLCQVVNKHKVRKLRVVADRAMFSDNNFRFFEELKDKLGIEAEYVVSCPLKKLPKDKQEKIFDFKKKQEMRGNNKFSAYYDFLYKGRRVVVSYSEKLRLCDEKKRHKLLDKLESFCKDGKVAASRLVKNAGVRRYFKTLKGSVEIDREKIARDRLWDGLYGVCTNMESKDKGEFLSLYRRLWKIEELFRVNKHTLKMRPIYHRLSQRIRAHILICFLAYSVLRSTEIVLKKAGCFLSCQELFDVLRRVETFIIRDEVKKSGVSYGVPQALSKEAKQIYRIFGKDYAKKPYKLN